MFKAAPVLFIYIVGNKEPIDDGFCAIGVWMEIDVEVYY